MRMNLAILMKERRLVKNALKNELYKTEEEKNDLHFADLGLYKIYKEILKFQWTRNFMDRRIVVYYLNNNCDLNAVARRFDINKKTATNRISKCNTLITEYFKDRNMNFMEHIIRHLDIKVIENDL